MEMKKTQKWKRIVVAIVIIFIFISLTLYGKLGNYEESTLEKYKYHIIAEEGVVEWPWEYRTFCEKYGIIDFENITYSVKSIERINNTEIIEELIGTCKVYGKDKYSNKSFDDIVEVYSVKGISKELLVAIGFEGEFYIYVNENIDKPQTFGAFLEMYSLKEYLDLDEFSVCEGYVEKGCYKIKDDTPIWRILTECKAVELEDTDQFMAEGSENYLTFSVTSEILGVYKQVVHISEDGYFDTNILEFGCTYHIGKEAACDIIKYAKENSVETEHEPYEQTISGIITEIGEVYVLIDDSSFCKNKQEGSVYKVYTEDIRVKRCIEFENSQIGDVVVISYRGDITDDKEIIGVHSMSKGEVEGGDIVILE